MLQLRAEFNKQRMERSERAAKTLTDNTYHCSDKKPNENDAIFRQDQVDQSHDLELAVSVSAPAIPEALGMMRFAEESATLSPVELVALTERIEPLSPATPPKVSMVFP